MTPLRGIDSFPSHPYQHQEFDQLQDCNKQCPGMPLAILQALACLRPNLENSQTRTNRAHHHHWLLLCVNRQRRHRQSTSGNAAPIGRYPVCSSPPAANCCNKQWWQTLHLLHSKRNSLPSIPPRALRPKIQIYMPPTKWQKIQ